VKTNSRNNDDKVILEDESKNQNGVSIDFLDLKPNIFGIGLNINEIVKWFSKKFNKNKVT